MAEAASAIDGQISEDGKQNWLLVEEFKEYHKDVLHWLIMKRLNLVWKN